VSDRRWSLATRLRLGFGLGAVVIVLLPAAAYVWLIGRTTTNLVEARAMEELHEFAAYVDAGRDSREMQEAAERLQSQHSDHRIGFRVFDARGTLTFGALGLDLFGTVVGPGKVGETERLDAAVVRATLRLADGSTGECALDGSQHFQRARALQLGVAGAALAAVCASLLVVEILARRTAGLITRVARSVRMHPSVRVPLEVQLEHPPEEIREIVEALQRLVERARSEDERSRLLISGLAHELRAPIQNLVLEGEVALLAPRERDEYRRVVEDQVELGREIADAVDNLVSLCRSGSPDEVVHREGFDLGIEVELRLERLRRGARRQGVGIELVTRGDLSFEGDREAVLRAVRNLVANALEWSPAGGSVLVELVGDERSVEVRVHDRGPGIAAADRERVFEPFVRLDADGARRAGYGLGLSIVRRAAEVHGGAARVDERPGGGTTASLRLPRLRLREPQPS
jgi:signal transduction histidine kinase